MSKLIDCNLLYLNLAPAFTRSNFVEIIGIRKLEALAYCVALSA